MKSSILPTNKKNEVSSSFFNKRNYLDDLFTNFFNDITEFTNPLTWDGTKTFLPKLDVYETSSDYRLEAELPGVREDDISLKINDNVLTIEGKRESTVIEKDHNYHIKERYFGSFSRSINLPLNVNEEQISAAFKCGVLSVILPKKEVSKSKEIKIKTT